MKSRSLCFFVAQGTLAFALLAGTSCTRQSPSPHLTQFAFQFGWIPDAHEIGWWTALDKNFYRDAGLNVTLLPGGLDSNPIKAVATGTADAAQASGIEQVLVARSEGLPVRALAAVQRHTPH